MNIYARGYFFKNIKINIRGFKNHLCMCFKIVKVLFLSKSFDKYKYDFYNKYQSDLLKKNA